jgi:TRAP-type transport system small permease protein
LADSENTFARLAIRAARLSEVLSKFIEVTVVLLMILLVLDVWLGVFVRYFVDLPLTFTEEAARYLMIWMALLAVSIGISRREHIGVLILFDRLGPKGRHILLGLFDLLGLFLFGFLLFYGVDFAISGFKRLTMIYGLPKFLPFAAVPVSCALACIQIILSGIRDQQKLHVEAGQGNLSV